MYILITALKLAVLTVDNFFPADLNPKGCGVNKFKNKYPKASRAPKVKKNPLAPDEIANGRDAKEGEVPWAIFIVNRGHQFVSL